MALVRCTCVTRLETSGGPLLTVVLPDPECDYVVHRLAQEAPAEPAY